MKKLGISLVIASLAFGNSAWAADYPKAYDETYETTMTGIGTQTTRYMSDGKGHVRSEVTQYNGESMIVLMDYPNKVLTTTMNIGAQKSFMKSPLGDYSEEDYKHDAKELGAKVIDKYPCHGYETTAKNGVVIQTWIADDLKCMVHSENGGPDQKTVTTLKSYSSSAPAFSMDLPAGYKEYKMPAN